MSPWPSFSMTLLFHDQLMHKVNGNDLYLVGYYNYSYTCHLFTVCFLSNLSKSFAKMASLIWSETLHWLINEWKLIEIMLVVEAIFTSRKYSFLNPQIKSLINNNFQSNHRRSKFRIQQISVNVLHLMLLMISERGLSEPPHLPIFQQIVVIYKTGYR